MREMLRITVRLVCRLRKRGKSYAKLRMEESHRHRLIITSSQAQKWHCSCRLTYDKLDPCPLPPTVSPAGRGEHKKGDVQMQNRTAMLVAVLGITLGAAALLASQDIVSNKTDHDRIVGAWRIATARGDGNDMPNDLRELARLAFSRDGKAQLTIAGEGKDEGQYKFAGEGQLDLNMGDRHDRELSPCIYKFDGEDRLLLCLNDNPQVAKRPTEFSGDRGTGQVLFVLERAKAGEEKPTAEELAKHKDLVDKIREVPLRTQTIDNLSQIGRAIYFYYDVHKHFPLHAIYDAEDKTPLLSWRVAILPYLQQDALYKEFKLDEAWDSPHNRSLISKMPKVFEPVGPAKRDVGQTYYQVFTGPDTVFEGTKKIRFKDIHDGTPHTILVIEAHDPVVWTRPTDLEMPKEMDKMPAIGGLFKDKTHVLFCDAHVEHLTRKVPPDVLRALVTPNGGEKVDLDPWK
jgi:uncharacterized protein (TIGR03067 family)